MKSKKALALALAATMTVGTLAGCGSGGSATTEATTTAPKTEAPTDKPTEKPTEKETEKETDKEPESTKGEEPGDDVVTAASNGMELPEIPGGVLKLNVSIADFNQTSEGTMIQELWQKRMEEYLGVELDITWQRTSWADFRTNELVILASGDVPDISTYSQGTAINEYGEDGVVLNLADYEDYIKYYWDYVNDTQGGKDTATTEDGSMYYFMDGFNNPDDIMGAQSFTAFAYRFDILQEHGLEPATTLEEFTQLCADLQALIDEGKLDTKYVMINSTKDYAFYRGFVGIFHTWDTLYWNGNEWSFGPIEDNFREMLTYLNELYEAGYMDPEIGTATSDEATVKATTNGAVIVPTLWAGMAASWNNALKDEDAEWGLAYLPEGDYGTAWKWGSKQDGKSLNTPFGIYISADVEYPEYAVAMIDFQYSDEMSDLLNWGVEGETYEVVNGEKQYIAEIMNAESPAIKSADYGLMASSVSRTGIPFVPQNFSAMLQVASLPEPWWNAEDGYYEGKYWIESDRNGGEDSVSPFDRPPVLRLTSEESTMKSQLTSACESYAKEQALSFITGEIDVTDDAVWAAYVEAVKSKTDENFDDVIEMLNNKSVK